MQVKQLDRAATIAWNPSEKHRSLLVSGTMAGTIDDSFQTNSHLEIYSVDLNDRSQNMRLLGNVVTKDCFNKIAWGGKGMDEPNGTLGAGLIAGGMSDGSINLWNAQAVMKGERMSLLARAEHHRGPVLGLEFHPQHTNLLASGSSDAEVYVWDLQSVSAPKPSKPHTRTTPLNSGITCLSWNKKVPQILATSSEIGETNVWDLRQKRAVLTFREESHAQIRASGLAWNPNQPVQIAVCYATPTVEIWDLRRSMSPEIKLQGGHGGPVMGLAWNPHDPNLLFSSGNDGNVVAWNVPQGQRLETFNFEGAIFDMQWAPNMPSFMSCSSVDGKVSIRSVHNFGYYVPSWLKRPVGAQFAFGGKLVSFAGPATPEAAPAPDQPAAPETPPGQIKIQQVSTDGTLIERAEQFQQALNNGDFVGFCNQKIQVASTDAEKQIWSFMRLLFESESDQKAQSLRFLGYESAAPPKPAAAEEPKQNGAPPAEPVRPKPVPKLADANQFFDSLASEPAPEEAETNGTSEHESDEGEAAKTVPGKEGAEAKKADAFVPENEDDIAIKKALIVGDFPTAVDRCLAADRIADALIFASCGGGSLWSKVQDAFFAKHPQQFVRNVIRGIVKGDLKQTVQSSDLKNWRETLAILMVYAESASFRELAASLAERLDRELRDSTAATIVYMCSGNMEQAAAIWARSVKGSNLPALQEAIEKIAVFGRAIKGSAQSSPLLSAKYAEYASWLVSQGKLAAAFRYLEVASPGTTGDVEVSGDASSDALKDRIFQALPDADKQFLPVPRFPYHKIHVSSPYATPAHAHHGHSAQYHPQQQQHQPQQVQQQPQPSPQQARNLAPAGRPGVPGQFPGSGGFPGQPNQPNQPNPAFAGQPNQPNNNFPGQPTQQNPNFAGANQPQPGGQPFGGQPNPGGWKPATPNPPNPAANASAGFQGGPLMGGARPLNATPSPGPAPGPAGGSLPLRPPGTAVPATGFAGGPAGAGPNAGPGLARPNVPGAMPTGAPPRPGPGFPGGPGPNNAPPNMGPANPNMPPNNNMPNAAGPNRPSIPNLGPNMPNNAGLAGPSPAAAAAAGSGPRPMPGGPNPGFPPSGSPPPNNPAFGPGPNNAGGFPPGPSQPSGAFPGPARPNMPPTGPAGAAPNPATPARPPMPNTGANMASPGPGPAVGQPGMPPRPVGPQGTFNPNPAPSPAAASPNPNGPAPGPGPAGFPARPAMPTAAPMRPMPGGAPMGAPMPGGSPMPNAGVPPGPNNVQPGFRPAPGPMNAGPGPMNAGPPSGPPKPAGFNQPPAGPFNPAPMGQPMPNQPQPFNPMNQPQPAGPPAGGMPPGPGGFYAAPPAGRFGAMPPYNPRPAQ